MSHKLDIQTAKQISLVELLAGLHFQPTKVRGNDYWYLSPLREEKTASFKVNQKLNAWYDFGTGEGGSIIDFGMRYYHCSLSELLEILGREHLPVITTSSFTHLQTEHPHAGLSILDVQALYHPALIQYLQRRSITLSIAEEFCKQVHFQIGGHNYFSLGFENNSGGYELRNTFFKGSSTPKDVTHINNHTPQLTVFEGFFDFLSFRMINEKIQIPFTSSLILNSLAFFERSRPLMEKYDQVLLLLDRDEAGRKSTETATGWNKKYIDHSDIYRGYKDLNEWHTSTSQKQDYL